MSIFKSPVSAALLLTLLAGPLLAEDAAEPAPKKWKAESHTYDLRAILGLHPDHPAESPLAYVPTNVAPNGAFAAPPQATNDGVVAELLRDGVPEVSQPEVSIEETAGQLAVTAPPEVQKKIGDYLQRLSLRLSRRIAAQVVEVAIPSAMSLDWLRRTGQVLPKAQLDELFKKADVKLRSSPQLWAYNGQRVRTRSGTSTTFTYDIDISGSCQDPVTRTLFNGVTVDLRPRITPDETAVSAQLRFWRTAADGDAGHVRFESVPPQSDGPPVVQGTPIDLIRQKLRCFETDLSAPLGSWCLAGFMGPVANAAEGSLDAKPTLLFVRFELIQDLSGAQ